MNILVTGGTGYIGSITSLALIEAGLQPVLLDNLVNSRPAVVDRIERVAGRRPRFVHGDIRDRALLDRVLRESSVDAVIHFAGLKAVGESAERPVDYYDVNVSGTLSLLRAMEAAECGKIIFSSSATVYGEPQFLPYTEEHPLAPTNVYGHTKRIAEQVLTDWAAARPDASVMLLRYFNPVGAHDSGRIGEDPSGIPNNLMPYLAQVAAGRLERLRIFGDDYPTPDGTGVRDYIHVVDLALAHIAALNRCAEAAGTEAYNIGTGQGYSVREMLQAFSSVVGRDLPAEVHPRRAGDVATVLADPRKAAATLDWRARYGLQDMVSSHWGWQSQNPMGYRTV